MFLYNENFLKKKNNLTFIYFIFGILILIPKIDLIAIPGYHAGIRVEDIIIFVFGIYLFLNLEKFHLSNKSLAFKLVIFFPYLVFSVMNGYFHNVVQYFAVIPRYIEYILLLLMIDNFLKNPKVIIIIAKLVITLNFIVSFLQKQNIVGGISSVKYYAPGDEFLARPFGLAGGAWELGIVVSISFFIIMISNKRNILLLLPFFLMTIYCLFIAETRGNIIAFFTTLLFFYNKNIFKNILIIIPLSLVTIYFLKDNLVLKNIISIDPYFLIDQFRYYFQYKKVNPDIFEFGQTYYSIGLRLKHLLPKYILFMDSNFIKFFGMGFKSLYYDSFILRVLFSFGIVGTLIIVFLIRKVNFGIIVFIILAGLTLDLFVSFKIFLIFSMYFKYVNLIKKEKIK